MKTLKKLVIYKEDVLFSIYPNGYRAFDDSALEELDGAFIKGIPENDMIQGVPSLTYDVSADVFQKIQLRDNTEYEFAIELPLSKEDFDNEYKKNEIFPFSNGALSKIVKFNGPDSCLSLQNNRFRVTGRFNFKNSAGTSYLDIKLSDLKTVVVPIEVLTQKLDYYDEFQQLLQQISEYHAELLIRFDTATETTFGAFLGEDVSPMSELMSFRRLFHNGRLSSYIREIINNPSTKTKTILVKEDLPFATNPDWSALSQSAIDYDYQTGGVLKDFFSGYTPINVPNREIKRTNDTQDNQFVKNSIILLKERLSNLQKEMPEIYTTSKTAMKKWHEEIEHLLMNPFWREISPCYHSQYSMVMTNRKGYKEFLTLFLAFGLSIKLENESNLLSIGGDIKPVFELYEMWCYLMIHKIISSLTGSDGIPVLNFSKNNKFSRSLTKKECNPIVFDYFYNDENKIEISLYYNKNFKLIDDEAEQWADSYSGVFTPDISISVTLDTSVHWIHFDAKYRLDMNLWKSQLSNDSGVASFKREDINKMHTYRDAVLGTRGSYVLFPGPEESSTEVYVRNPDKKYRDKYFMPSVGAFPLKPTSTQSQSDQSERLKDHIKNCIDSLVEHKFPYKEELGFK